MKWWGVLVAVLSMVRVEALAQAPSDTQQQAIEALNPYDQIVQEFALRDARVAYKGGDYATALRLFKPLAERGNVSAQRYLGEMHASGSGVSMDSVQAYMWLDLAAAQGDDSARAYRDMIALAMSPAHIALAQQLSRDWSGRARP